MFVKETLPYLSVLGRYERDSLNNSEIVSIYDPPFHSCPNCRAMTSSNLECLMVDKGISARTAIRLFPVLMALSIIGKGWAAT